MAKLSNFSNVLWQTNVSVVMKLFCIWLLSSSIKETRGSDDTVRATAAAILEQRAQLPCDVRSHRAKDRPVLILWYKDLEGTPIYSFDARGIDLMDGRHWAEEKLLGERAYFRLTSLIGHPNRPHNREFGGGQDEQHSLNHFGAYLELNPALKGDEAMYRCRVDFLYSPTRNTLVNFSVILPPDPPTIYNETEDMIGGGIYGASIIGPYDEGSALSLYCDVSGGRPVPNVEWLINNVPAKSESVRKPGGIVRSKLEIRNLSRDYLHAVLDCRASNFNKSAPISSTVTIDMNFRPANVEIKDSTLPLSDTGEYEIVCESWGSKPPARITWWKGGAMQMKDAKSTISADNNVTTSVLRYHAKMIDNQKYLTCRANNIHLSGSAKESGMQINVQYKPVVTLHMGSTLDPDTIKEGDDVYFECHINSNPNVDTVLWLQDGALLNQDVTRGIILQNQSLVLQSIKRSASGIYTCKAFNSEGEGESNPVSLIVKYKPYCKKQHQTIFGTALNEAAAVTCEVEALPGPVTFRWTFNNSSENVPIPPSAVTSKDLESVARYAPKSHLDYGTLLCWPKNSIGKQSSPCAFAIIPAGPPDPPENCSITNQTSTTIQIECSAGFNGGLPQVFYLEAYVGKTKELYRNVSLMDPNFLLNSLKAGLSMHLSIYSANSKGRSKPVKFEISTLKVAEKRTSPPSLFGSSPIFVFLIIVGVAVVVIACVIIIALRFRRHVSFSSSFNGPLHNGDSCGKRSSNEEKVNQPMNIKASLAHISENSVKQNILGDSDDVNPDVIPQEKELLSHNPNQLDRQPALEKHLNPVQLNDRMGVSQEGYLDPTYQHEIYAELQKLVETSSEQASGEENILFKIQSVNNARTLNDLTRFRGAFCYSNKNNSPTPLKSSSSYFTPYFTNSPETNLFGERNYCRKSNCLTEINYSPASNSRFVNRNMCVNYLPEESESIV